MTVLAGSQCDRIARFLSDGEWHTSRELHEACGYMRTNSRVAELRSKHGYEIVGESVPGKVGTDGYRYRLVTSPSIEVAETQNAPLAADGQGGAASRDLATPAALPSPLDHSAGLQLSLLEAA